MSDSILALPYRTPVDLRLAALTPALRVVGSVMKLFGGGVLFAATIFLMVALPGLIE